MAFTRVMHESLICLYLNMWHLGHAQRSKSLSHFCFSFSPILSLALYCLPQHSLKTQWFSGALFTDKQERSRIAAPPLFWHSLQHSDSKIINGSHRFAVLYQKQYKQQYISIIFLMRRTDFIPELTSQYIFHSVGNPHRLETLNDFFICGWYLWPTEHISHIV